MIYENKLQSKDTVALSCSTCKGNHKSRNHPPQLIAGVDADFLFQRLVKPSIVLDSAVVRHHMMTNCLCL